MLMPDAHVHAHGHYQVDNHRGVPPDCVCLPPAARTPVGRETEDAAVAAGPGVGPVATLRAVHNWALQTTPMPTPTPMLLTQATVHIPIIILTGAAAVATTVFTICFTITITITIIASCYNVSHETR